jgi:hypothetical protein
MRVHNEPMLGLYSIFNKELLKEKRTNDKASSTSNNVEDWKSWRQVQLSASFLMLSRHIM